MPALHAPVTAAARADRNAKLAHYRPLDRQVFLVLRDDTVRPDDAREVRAPRRQRGVIDDIDARRDGRCAVRPYAAPGLRPGRSGCSFGNPREKGAACRVA